VHSIADVANQALLYIGLKRSTKKADNKYAYGYSAERFFWALISACGVLFVGAGVTIFRGVDAIFSGGEIHTSLLIVFILVVSLCIESFTLRIALRELADAHKGKKITEALKDGDPITVAVVYEDAAAVIGVCVALVGVYLSYLTHDSFYDGMGAIVIGCILAVVALLLIMKNRGYLLHKSIPRDIEDAIVRLLEREACIESVKEFKSITLDTSVYHIKCEVEWDTTGMLSHIKRDETLRELHERIANDFTEFKRVMVEEVERVPRLIGREIDAIEARVKKAFPNVAHIDIEIN
jgi:solute carrier family 30 (zinc transporter), member 9